MEQYSGNRRQHLFDFDWYFTRELPRLKDRYTGAHYTYKTTKAGQRCPLCAGRMGCIGLAQTGFATRLAGGGSL